MSTTQINISKLLGNLKNLSPTGYAIGLQITYTTPKFMFQTYNKDWLNFYSQNGLLLTDPTLMWGFENVGAVRWGDLKDNDPSNVLGHAKEHGIVFGLTCAKESTDNDGVRSIGSLSRGDRDFSDAEISEIQAIFDELHSTTENQARLSAATVEQLKKMSIMVTHPGS